MEFFVFLVSLVQQDALLVTIARPVADLLQNAHQERIKVVKVVKIVA